MKPTRRAVLALLISTVLAGCSGGATEPDLGTVKGVVKDNIGNPLANVTLLLQRTGRTPKSAVSSSEGAFSFSRLEAGSWMLEISAPPDYTVPTSQTNPLPVTVRAARATDVTVTLARKPNPPGGGPVGPTSR